jgi:hypothetical protein
MFEVVEVHKITDTLEEGTYELDITLLVDGEEVRAPRYISSRYDPHGANPAIRLWMSQNPDFPVHAYVPPVVVEPVE